MKVFGSFFILFALVSLSGQESNPVLPDYFPAEFNGQLKWTMPGYPLPSAIARDGRLYFRKDTKLISLDGLTLEKQWEIELGEPGGAASMGGDGRLYLSSSESGKVFCVDRRNGKKVWVKEFGTGSHSGTPSLMYVPGKSNLLFFCPAPKKEGANEPVYGINASNGELLWTNEERLQKPYPGGANTGNPTIGSDGTVYVANHWRYVWAFEGKTGKIKWEFNAGKSGLPTVPVLGSDGTVFVGSWNGNLYAIDGKTGKEKWKTPLGAGVENFPVVGRDDTVYVGAKNKKFFALNGQTGAKKWGITLNGANSWQSSTLCSDGQLLISTDGGLYSVDSKTGRKNWRLTEKHKLRVGHRLSSDGTLYLELDNVLYALQTAIGPDPKALWPQIGYNGANTAFTGVNQQDPLRIPEETIAVRHAWEKKETEQPKALSIETIAGSGKGNADGIGSAASFLSLAGFATDGKDLFVSDHHGHAIRKIDLARNEVTTLAGSGKKGKADGIGQAASFSGPNQMTYHNGKLYLADQLNHLIRSIDVKSGKVETIAGTGDDDSSVDGVGLSASFNFPVGIDCNGTHLFVTEILLHKIRMLELATGKVTTLAHSDPRGDSTRKGERDGALDNFTFDSPGGIAARGSVLYLADKQRDKRRSLIRKIDLDTKQTTTLPSHGVPLLDPHGLSLEGGCLVVSDRGNGCILKFNLVKEEWSVVAGIPGVRGKKDCLIESAELAGPQDCVVLGSSLYTGGDGSLNGQRAITVRKVNLPPGYFPPSKVAVPESAKEIIPLTDGNFKAAVDLWFSDQARALATYGHIKDWNTSSVTDMYQAFNNQFHKNRGAFNEDIGNWDVSAVTNMQGMFNRASVFNQDISEWNVSKVTNMAYIFNGANAFNQDIGSWQVSAVTNMREMFDGASSFNQDISDWNVSSVKNMGNMLNHTRALSDENKGRIHASFSSNPHWKYDWGAFGAVPLGKNESVSNHGDGLSVKTWSKARDGLLLWLDASDVDGDGKTDAVREPYPLSTWVDKAGKDHDAKPFEVGEKAKVRFGLKAERPNLGMVHFDGNGSMIFPKIDKVRTLVCVVERGGKCPTHTTFIGNSASSKTWGYHGNHRIRQYGLRSVYEGLQRRDGEPIKFNQGGSFLKQLQITVLVTKAEVTADWLGLRKDGAGNRYFMGNYAEIMIYDRPLEEPEILSIEKYLSDKWGIAIKHDGTNRVGDFPWVGNVLPVLAQGDSPPKQKEKPAKMVTGAVIMASLTLPVDVLNVEMKKKLPAGELKPGKVIQEGYEVKVGAGGEAVLLFSNGALTTLGEKTTLKITQFVQDKFTEKEGRAFGFGEEPSVSNTLLDLARGDLVVEVKKLKKKSNFEITTPLGVAGIRGTRFTINLREMNDAPDSIAIAVTEGAVYCKPAKGGKPAGKELSLNAGEAIDYSSSFSETALADLKPVKFDLGKENEVAAEPPPSLVSLPEILKALNEVNSRGNLSPKLTPFQKMRQKKVPRKR